MKKIFKIMLFSLLMFIGISSVSASKELTESDVIERYKKYYNNDEPAEVCTYYGIYRESSAKNILEITNFENGEKVKAILVISSDRNKAYLNAGSKYVSLSIDGSNLNCNDYLELRTNKAIKNAGGYYYDATFKLYNSVDIELLSKGNITIFRKYQKPEDTKTYHCNYLDENGKNGYIRLIFDSNYQYIGGFDNTIISQGYFLKSELLQGKCPEVDICKNKKSYEIFIDDYSKLYDSDKCFHRFETETVESEKFCLSFSSIEQDENILNEKNREEKLKNYCRNAFKNLPYTSSCSQVCIEYMKSIGEYTEANVNSCGFSQKLLVWIVNILRWVKYIIPVIIIILSILDFLKALAAEKEDDMKKAQKRFTTRLIVAVLIFIMPLIIEFVLTKMGFSADSCGIGNLGLGK